MNPMNSTGAGDRLAEAVAELYAASPETFTERRGQLAAAARSAGDRAAAKAIGALRKPTRAAWVVNLLARTDPSAPAKLAELGGALRAALQARDGARLRELSAARGALIDGLTAQALAAAGVPEPPSALREEVAATLTAAFADSGVATAFAAGTLTRAEHWSGFGSAGQAERSAPEPARPGTVIALRGAKQASESRGASGAELVQEQLAREAAERAAARREKYAESKRVLAAAVAASGAAGRAEDRLEGEVRDLEARLTRVRAELAAARVRARHAEAAQRRARAALDRLPRLLPGMGATRLTLHPLWMGAARMTATGQSCAKP
jgi:hypothetical protein